SYLSVRTYPSTLAKKVCVCVCTRPTHLSTLANVCVYEILAPQEERERECVCVCADHAAEVLQELHEPDRVCVCVCVFVEADCAVCSGDLIRCVCVCRR